MFGSEKIAVGIDAKKGIVVTGANSGPQTSNDCRLIPSAATNDFLDGFLPSFPKAD